MKTNETAQNLRKPRPYVLLLAFVTCTSGCFIATDPPAPPNQPADATDTVAASDSDALDSLDALDTADQSDQPLGQVICDEGELRCHGRELQACGEDRLSWNEGEQCAETAECRDGECVELPLEYSTYCNDDLASCPLDLICQYGLCLANYVADERGAPCLIEAECQKPLFCSGLGVCSEGTEADGCLSDLDCRGATPVCNPFSRLCSSGALGSPCVPTQGCDVPWLCGPELVCHTGLDGSPCTDASHCALASPICGSSGSCQDGEQGDDCDGPEHCASHNFCTDSYCRTPGEGDPCSNDGDCPSDSAPFCDPDGFCANGSRDDRCYDDDGCFPSLVCGPGGICQLGGHGEPCDSEADCAFAAPICFNSACQDGGLNDNCAEDEHCGPATPFCGPSGVCQRGTTDDLCDGEQDCVETLVCRESDRCGGAMGDPCATEADCGPDAPICTGWGRCDNGTHGALCRTVSDCNVGLYCESDRCFDGRDNDLCSEDTQCFGSDLDCVTPSCVADLCSMTVEAGYCVLEGVCVSDGESSEENPCVECVANTNPLSWTSDDENVCTANPHVTSTECSAGVCFITDCDADWNDCDDAAGNGCETAIILDPRHCGGCDVRCVGGRSCAADGCTDACAPLTDCAGVCRDTTSDPAHCGGCDQPCPESTDPALVSVCDSGCVEQVCPENTWNVDGDSVNGCEYACVADGEETCDDTDNDCDGAVDEDFPLMWDYSGDPRHCGGCNRPCEGENVEWFECLGGVCFPRLCDDGFELSGDLTSCVRLPEPSSTLYVREGESGDGTEGNPFGTINDALAIATEDTLIRIAEGVYPEYVHVDTNGIMLTGVKGNSDAVVIQGVGGAEAMLVSGNEVRIAYLNVTLSPVGIVVQGQNVRLSGLRINQISAPEQTEAEESLVTAYGLVLDNADGTFVSDTNVFEIDGAPATYAGGGSAAVGIHVFESDNVTLVDCSVNEITGGDSPVANDNSPGGWATGIWIQDSLSVAMHGVSGELVTGGAGTPASDLEPGAGGQAIGIDLQNADDCSIAASAASNITGGAGGFSELAVRPPGEGGIGVGIRLDETTGCSVLGYVAGGIDGGSRGYYLDEGGDTQPEITQPGYGLWIEPNSVDNNWPDVAPTLIDSGMFISPHSLNEPEFPDTLFPIVVLYGASDTVISGLDLSSNVNPTNWGKVAIFDSQRITISDVTIANQTGVAGCTGAPACDGGASTGIFLQNCHDCLIEDVRVTNVNGGCGGLGGYAPDQDGGNGGDYMAIGLYGNTTATISRLLVHDFAGGNGGFTTNADADPGDPGTAICVYAQDTAVGTVDRMTCYGGDSDNPTTGANVSGSSPSLVIEDSILSELDAGCVLESSDAISLQYSVLHECDIESADETTVSGDPLFVYAPLDFHVSCDAEACSSAVDAGAPISGCNEERPPNGGRINAGYYGDTGETPPNPGAVDVFPCPE